MSSLQLAVLERVRGGVVDLVETPALALAERVQVASALAVLARPA